MRASGLRGAGVAHRLVAWVEGIAFVERRSRLRAVVPAGDDRSQHLYRAHEFVPRPVGGGSETIVLEKLLPVA